MLAPFGPVEQIENTRRARGEAGEKGDLQDGYWKIEVAFSLGAIENRG
jgi:hypothetical protein